MTNLQIEANKLAETTRANKAKEFETRRSNLQQERLIPSKIRESNTKAFSNVAKGAANIVKGASNFLDDVKYKPAREGAQNFKNMTSGITSGVKAIGGIL